MSGDRPVAPVHPGIVELHGDGSIDLVGGWSPTSSRHHFPLLDTCPYSGARDVERVLLSRAATLWAWTAVTTAPPGYAGRVPYGFGIVELTAERLRIVTRLREADPSRLRFGQPMTLVADILERGVEPEAPDDGAADADGRLVTWSFA